MWGGKPVDGFATVICWLRGHEWPVAADERGEIADADRCTRCHKRRSTE